ncbi:MAG: radical SAM protein [Proteobacteria bacterium]|nr:radical SAM protein [Pseudomonadota bacterium]
MILINPPIVKPSEPPAGIAKLSGALHAANIRHYILDANIEGIYYLLNNAPKPVDTWTRRASRHLSRNLEALKNRDIYRNIDRYKRAIMDVNRILESAAAGTGSRLSLADYYHAGLSPVKSSDLIYVAEHPEESPFYPYFSVRLSEFVKGEGITTAGFSLNYLSQALTAFAMIGFLKREFPRVKVIIGGGLITSWMRNTGWKNPFGGLLDHCVSGPGEIPLLEILGKKISKKSNYRPSYDLMPVKDYLSPGFILPFSSSTGCYWGKCTFCPEKAEGNRYSQIRPDSVIDDLSYLIDRHGPVLIHLTDNAISPVMMKKIVERPPGVPWYGFVRVAEYLADPYFCRALKNSGCVMLKLGLESGDQRVLDFMNKGCDVKTASKVLKTIKEAGISTYIYLLFGTPSETIDEARNTLDFVVNHSDFIDFMNLAVFNLPVNSSEARKVNTVDFYEGDLSLYTDFRHPAGWGRRQVRDFLDKEFKRDPAVQSIIHRQPQFFTSNHAPFFMMDQKNH